MDDTNYFERALKKRHPNEKTVSNYIDCRFLVATSNTVERLFSAARWIMMDLWRQMSPIMFEAMLYLKTNHEFWDIQMLAEAMKDDPSSGATEQDNDHYYEGDTDNFD